MLTVAGTGVLNQPWPLLWQHALTRSSLPNYPAVTQCHGNVTGNQKMCFVVDYKQSKSTDRKREEVLFVLAWLELKFICHGDASSFFWTMTKDSDNVTEDGIGLWQRDSVEFAVSSNCGWRCSKEVEFCDSAPLQYTCSNLSKCHDLKYFISVSHNFSFTALISILYSFPVLSTRFTV